MNEQPTQSIDSMVKNHIHKIDEDAWEKYDNGLITEVEMVERIKQAMRELVEEVLGEIENEIPVIDIESRKEYYATDFVDSSQKSFDRGQNYASSIIKRKLTQLKGGSKDE